MTDGPKTRAKEIIILACYRNNTEQKISGHIHHMQCDVMYKHVPIVCINGAQIVEEMHPEISTIHALMDFKLRGRI